MKRRGVRPVTVRKYAEMITTIRELCMRQKALNFKSISRAYRVDNKLGYTLVTLGIIESRDHRIGRRDALYAWINPNNMSDVEIAQLVAEYNTKLRISKGTKATLKRNPRQTTLPTPQSKPSKQPTKDSYHSRITEPPKPKQVTPQANGLNVNIVRLRMFGLTIFEYETRGKN